MNVLTYCNFEENAIFIGFRSISCIDMTGLLQNAHDICPLVWGQSHALI